MGEIRVLLRGGPKDGQEIAVGTDDGGRHVPRVELPMCAPRPPARVPVLVYERDRRGNCATWEFVYVGALT